MARKSSDERRQEIVQAVLDLIAVEGIQGITMSRIAAKVGISEAALYRHFRSKLDIVHTTIGTVFDQILALLASAATTGDAPTDVQRVFTAHLRFIERHPGVARILFSDEIHFNNLALRNELNGRIVQLLDFIADFLSTGVAAGNLPQDLDVENAAVLYLGLIQAQVLLWTLEEKKYSLTARADRLWALYEKAIKNGIICN
jgi:AcrR family transcriptional regulator